MSALTDVGIDHLAEAIDHAKRTMFRERVPRIEREVFAEEVLLRSIELLRGNQDGRHLHEGRL